MPTVNYLWNPLNDNIVREFDDAGTVIAEYTTDANQFGGVVSQRRNGLDSVYHYDGLGSTLALTNANGDVTDTYAYSAFGEVTARSGSTVNPLQYIGQKGYYRDAETGEYEVRRRVLGRAEGRWLSIDPLRLRMHEEGVYIYVRNQSTRYNDPSGLMTLYDAIVYNCIASCKIYVSDSASMDDRRAIRDIMDKCQNDCVADVTRLLWTDCGIASRIFDKWLAHELAELSTWYKPRHPVWPTCPCVLKKQACRSQKSAKTIIIWSLDGDDALDWTQPTTLWDSTYHPGAKYEIRSRNAPDGAGDQCTYDANGVLLTQPPSAGSADRFPPTWYNTLMALHWYHDMEPFRLAQTIDRLCVPVKTPTAVSRYFMVRPANNYRGCS